MKKIGILGMLLSVALILILALVGCATKKTPTPTQPPRPAPVISAVPASIPAESNFDVSGSGFLPDEPVLLFIVGKTTTENIYLGGGFHADANGAFLAKGFLVQGDYDKASQAKQIALQTPKLKPGTYTIEADSQSGSAVTTTLTVTEKK